MNVRHPITRVLEHNVKAAAMWSGGGRAYDEISRGIAEGIRHCVERLGPRPGERILDIATGTGWTAREVRRRGASVVAVDIADGLLEAAKQLAEEEALSIDWQLGDAERLPFEDGAFDAAISTFGIMFTPNQEAAVQELTRVVRPGGRIAVAAWRPDSNPVALRKVVGAFMPPPPKPAAPPPSPFNWGDPAWLSSALGGAFSLGHETGDAIHRMASAEHAWNIYETGFGPVRAISKMLDGSKRQELRAAFEAWADNFRTDLGVAINFQYLVTVGTKKK